MRVVHLRFRPLRTLICATLCPQCLSYRFAPRVSLKQSSVADVDGNAVTDPHLLSADEMPLVPASSPESSVIFHRARHPFPSLDWSDVNLVPAVSGCILMLLAGIVCSAGGLGGGGVYVTILMVAGQLSPHDAVPLSKAVVFLGSMSSLLLNLRKSLSQEPDGSRSPSLIDLNVCRLVVPSALLGTLIGVMINSQVPAAVIVALLTGILSCVSFMSVKTCLDQWRAESFALVQSSGELQARPAFSSEATKQGTKSALRDTLLRGEALGAFGLLCLIISSGVFRGHASACRHKTASALTALLSPPFCRAPIISSILGEEFLTNLMSMGKVSEHILFACLLVPFCLCCSAAIAYGVALVKNEGYSTGQVLRYCSMALFAGAFAGLVGIGGGMIFAPAFLFMGLEPSSAVATSSTCVIFTSCSTTFQFLLTDRISLSLGLLYGTINAVASYLGTRLVHWLQDRYGTRKSYISGVVCFGVLLSVSLSAYKLYAMGVRSDEVH